LGTYSPGQSTTEGLPGEKLGTKIKDMSWKITCKQAVDYISKKEEGKLSIGQRFQLWQHLFICRFCRLFLKQNKLIKKAFQQKKDNEVSLSTEEKQKMADSILSGK
jgi:hypothetical protein